MLNAHATLDIKESIIEHTQQTSLHGVSNITSNKKSKVQKAAWVVLFLLSTSVFLYFLSKVLIRYFSYPVSTIQTNIPATHLDLPCLTICNHNIMRKSYINQLPPEHHVLGEVFKYFGPVMVASKLNPEETLRNIVLHNLSDINLEDVGQLGAQQFDEMVVHYNIGQTINSNPEGIVESRFSQGGYCHTIHPASYIDEHGGMKIFRAGIKGGIAMVININKDDYYASVEGSTGIKLLVHSPDDEPLMNEASISVSPGTHAKIMISRKDIKNLPYGPNSCLDISDDSFHNPLQYFSQYSYNGCITECLVNFLNQSCGCRFYFHHAESIPVCSIEKTVTCAIPQSVLYYKTPSIEESCACIRQCHRTDYQMSISLSDFPSSDAASYLLNHQVNENNSLSLIYVYFGELGYTLLEHVASYPAASVFGDIGGLMGLCMGASLLTLAEFVEFVTVLCCACCKRSKATTAIVMPQEDVMEKSDPKD